MSHFRPEHDQQPVDLATDLRQTVDQVTEEALNLGYRLEQRFALGRERRAKRRGDIPVMVAFDGYGSTTRVRILGRALLKTTGPEDPTDEDESSIRGWRSFTSLPITFAHVDVNLGGKDFRLVADKGGVIDADLAISLEPGVHEAHLRTEGSSWATSKVTVVEDGQRIGVVSDVDDTVMVTALPRPMLAAWNSFVLNEHARAPTPGMAVLMERLSRRYTGAPFIYLSTGAWNVAPTLRRFLSRNAYPSGSLLLTDWGPTTDRWFRSGARHKVENLEHLAQNFPDIKWILIGDDGQHDPQIYGGFAQRYPEHVAAVVIRNLSTAEAVLASGQFLAEDGPRIPEGIPLIEANDGATISEKLSEAGLL
ncbi:DUF2183 domain-containing protein [Kocuria coralli]|uniref:DUF2183 domain-containing protein n=1 Tax=Kocuria coralli TaxID=1461025 RepID=A0A5J5KWF9_9MICC|nr:phosphatase domain-containing protein [Kocuria coralli]KAA9393181.1 DUF2183 domain-containing protein [Kocuria coralli]